MRNVVATFTPDGSTKYIFSLAQNRSRLRIHFSKNVPKAYGSIQPIYKVFNSPTASRPDRPDHPHPAHDHHSLQPLPPPSDRPPLPPSRPRSPPPTHPASYPRAFSTTSTAVHRPGHAARPHQRAASRVHRVPLARRAHDRGPRRRRAGRRSDARNGRTGPEA
ncbi:LOW QUALITY PROTEIN: hypothetical protein BC937DRAFT_86652 [Endogone sp. FLAS-F59071]|nr:LOW QUALITY PROTEIN: hypothetical protein BC937DRAFT_86652 [Endogone sp. FLAS-F59071]|eukprot:RUS19962.1 LOW QUALITY PROTEIN: hypothetical protein BC937DRAFT_86652 [Endogone sp. FLAS-F59071]